MAVFGVHARRKHRVGLVINSLNLTTGEVIGDSALIHQDIKYVFREHNEMPLDFNNEMHRASD